MEILLVIIGVAIFIRVWLSQLGLHKQADKHHKELVDKFESLHNVIVPKGTLCLSCEKELATNGIGETKTVCSKCWNKMCA